VSVYDSLLTQFECGVKWPKHDAGSSLVSSMRWMESSVTSPSDRHVLPSRSGAMRGPASVAVTHNQTTEGCLLFLERREGLGSHYKDMKARAVGHADVLCPQIVLVDRMGCRREREPLALNYVVCRGLGL
jgi:hypothetical protein